MHKVSVLKYVAKHLDRGRVQSCKDVCLTGPSTYVCPISDLDIRVRLIFVSNLDIRVRLIIVPGTPSSVGLSNTLLQWSCGACTCWFIVSAAVFLLIAVSGVKLTFNFVFFVVPGVHKAVFNTILLLADTWSSVFGTDSKSEYLFKCSPSVS